MEPEISIITPAFNEEESLPLFYEKVSRQLNEIGINWEIIIVDDGSRDQTAAVAKKLHQRDSRVKVIVFSRNFGTQVSISAGLDASAGRAVVVMDADLQHPPELLTEMIRL
ncbi:MAG: glycosyltransferase family 2 protein [Planctomycetia bacterium]|nr:glycosyltransferase family 2 protein [Planctomycetia bacterium]